MDVSIIIINYNTYKLTLDCLRSIYEKTTGISFEIIVVDNASSDNSVEYIKKEYPQIHLIENHQNIGFGRGNNLGYKYANSKYVFLLNPDTIIVNNAIGILCNFLDSNKEISVVGGQLLDEKLSPMHSYSFIYPSLKWELNILLRGFISKCKEHNARILLDNNTFFPVAYITGADMMIRKSVVDELGFFDSDFFMYFEETELSYRYLLNGYVSYCYPEARIIHLEGKSFDFMEKREKAYFYGRNLFYKKKYSKIYVFICNLVYLTVCIIRITFFLLTLNKKKLVEWSKRLYIFLLSII